MTIGLPTLSFSLYMKLFQRETLTNRSVSRRHEPFCKMSACWSVCPFECCFQIWHWCC